MNETITNLMSRKSCKSYSGEHISKENLDLIIKAGLNAPTGKNMQTPIFVATQNEKIIEKLSNLNAKVLGADVDPFYNAKDLIIVLVKKQGTYVYDGSLAMGNLLNAAYSLNIDACWIHRAKEVFELESGKEFLKSIGITEEVEGIGFCVLGYKNKEREKTIIKENRVFYV